VLKVIPTATVLIRVGKNTIERRKSLVFTCGELKNDASKKPSTTFEPDVTTAYTSVFLKLVLSEISEKKSI
jgi:hypothetical protein